MKFHTWRITVSTAEDIDRMVADSIVSYLKKKCRYGYVCLEMAKKLHLHAVVCFVSPIEKKHFEETIWDKVHKRHSSSIKRIALKSNVQYDHMWVDDYLQKDPTRTVLWDKVDKKDWAQFYPTQEQQDELKAAYEAKKPVAGESKDPYFTKLEAMWIEHTTDESYESAYKFLKYAMNVERSIQVMKDPRALMQTALALHHFRTKNVDVPADAIRFYNQHYGLCS